MDKQQQQIVARALKQLENPALEKSKAARRLEKVLVGARETNKLPTDDLRRATVDLVDEVNPAKFFAKSSGGADGDDALDGLGFLFLLILLLLLLALLEGTDAGTLIEQLIQDLLDSLRGG